MDITVDNIQIDSETGTVTVSTPIAASDLIAQQQLIIDNTNSNINKWNAANELRVSETESANNDITNARADIAQAQAVIDKINEGIS